MEDSIGSIKWKVWPLIERKWKTILMIAATFLFSYASFDYTKSFIVLSIIIFIFLFELRNYIFPTEYELTDEGIKTSTLFSNKDYKWQSFKKAWFDKNGVLLSPFNKKSFLERFRGKYILFGENTPLEVKEFLQNKY